VDTTKLELRKVMNGKYLSRLSLDCMSG